MLQFTSGSTILFLSVRSPLVLSELKLSADNFNLVEVLVSRINYFSMHLAPQERIFLLCISCVVLVGSVAHLICKSQPDFAKAIEMDDVRPFIRRVNVNRASAQELAHIPYIGEKIAQKIVQYRKEHGDFHAVRDLYAVEEISLGLMNKIVPYLKIH